MAFEILRSRFKKPTKQKPPPVIRIYSAAERQERLGRFAQDLYERNLKFGEKFAAEKRDEFVLKNGIK